MRARERAASVTAVIADRHVWAHAYRAMMYLIMMKQPLVRLEPTNTKELQSVRKPCIVHKCIC